MPTLNLIRPPTVRLAKIISPEGITSYPNVKRFSSDTVEYANIEELFELIETASTEGKAILTGNLLKPLVNESRKGQTEKNSPTTLLVLDFDDIPVASTNPSLLETARAVLANLPGRFLSTDYIVQASSSYGLKDKRVSFHVFYLLNIEANPRQIKDYLTHLNLSSAYLKQYVRLTDSGMALHFPLDRIVNDSGRLIYIAQPVFSNGAVNPLGERQFLVKGSHRELITEELLADTPLPEVLRTQSNKTLNALRKERGLKPRRTKTITMDVDGEKIEVVSNPDAVRMTIASDEGEFVRYNINGGDSNAYWVHKYYPDVVYNFKGEPNFLFSEACEEAYEHHIELFPIPDDGTFTEDIPVAFLDYSSARYFYGLINVNDDRVRSLHACSQGDIKHFLTEYGRVTPKTLPVWRYEFRPDVVKVIDLPNRFINRYQPPDVVADPIRLSANLDRRFGYASDSIRKIAPNCYKVIYSVCGNSDPEFEYFMNWLAFVVQFRQKTLTSWVFHGVPGTGKGLMHAYILAPIIGEDYAKMKRMTDIEEQFNQWIEECLLLSVDEFRAQNTKQKGLMNKLKNMITETKGTVRAMRSDQIERRLYTNLIFFSNNIDAMEIQEGDRRFNVAPRQETPIVARYPELFAADNIIPQFEKEIAALAAYLLEFQVDQASVRVPLENEAKKIMTEDSATTVDLFVTALKQGDLDYFVPIISEPVTSRNAEALLYAKEVLSQIVRDYDEGKAQIIFSTELRALYNVVCGASESEQKFGKMLAHHGLRPIRYRKGSMSKQGVRVEWQLKDNDIDFLRKELGVKPTNARIVQMGEADAG